MSWDNFTHAGFSHQSIGLTGHRAASKKEIMCAAASPLHTLSFFFLRSRARSGLRETLVSLSDRGPTFCPNFCPNLRAWEAPYQEQPPPADRRTTNDDC